MNTDIQTYLEFQYSTSRGAETYGYPIMRLIDSHYQGKAYKSMGGGYDVHGTNLGHWLQDIIKENDLLLQAFAIDLLKYIKKENEIPYGLNFPRDFFQRDDRNRIIIKNYAKIKRAILEKTWTLDGACGERCMKDIALIVGIEIKDQYQRAKRKGQTDKYLGSNVYLTPKNTYRKLCEKAGVKLHV